MKKLNFLFILCIVLIINVSCGGGDDEIKLLQINERPLVAIIDGVTIDFLIQPRAEIVQCDDIPCMWLNGRNAQGENKELFFTINNLTETGTYDLGLASNNFGEYSTSPLNGGELTSYGSFNDQGFLAVTSYEGNKIKGNFSFLAKNNYDESDIISISGTFDLQVSE